MTVFRSAYEQIGNTLALWIDSGVDRSWGGMVIPMTWFQALNPLLVITMTPLLLAHWRRRAEAEARHPAGPAHGDRRVDRRRCPIPCSPP